MKKKLLVAALAATMMLTFVGCGDATPSTEATTEATTEASTEATTEASTEANTEATTETEQKVEIEFTDCDENLKVNCAVSLYKDAEATQFAGRVAEGESVHVTGKSDDIYRAEVDGEVVYIKTGINTFAE